MLEGSIFKMYFLRVHLKKNVEMYFLMEQVLKCIFGDSIVLRDIFVSFLKCIF